VTIDIEAIKERAELIISNPWADASRRELSENILSLVAEVERLERLRAWDERPATLPGGLVMEHARLDGMWQRLVQDNDALRAEVAELKVSLASMREASEAASARHVVQHEEIERLRAEVAAMRPVVEAARTWRTTPEMPQIKGVLRAVDAYEAALAGKEPSRG